MAVNRDLALRPWTTGLGRLMTVWSAMTIFSAQASGEPPAQAPAGTSAQPAVPASAPAPVAPAAASAPADPTAKKVRLEFQGQEWLPVLDWLAKTRNLNLDWQQLPQGTLNLASANEYSIEEAEDLINMQL